MALYRSWINSKQSLSMSIQFLFSMFNIKFLMNQNLFSDYFFIERKSIRNIIHSKEKKTYWKMDYCKDSKKKITFVIKWRKDWLGLKEKTSINEGVRYINLDREITKIYLIKNHYL